MQRMAFEAKYTAEQKTAIVEAYTDPRHSAADVRRLATEGQLETAGGARLAPFDVPEGSIRSFARQARVVTRRIYGGPLTGTSDEMIEQIRQRLITGLQEEWD